MVKRSQQKAWPGLEPGWEPVLRPSNATQQRNAIARLGGA